MGALRCRRVYARLVATCAALALCLHSCEAALRVVVPTQANARPIEHKLAMFGRPEYGKALIAPIVLAPETNRRACGEFDREQLATAMHRYGVDTHSDHEADGAFLLMVERGQCHFVEKARHAQTAGAVGVVIYDTNKEKQKLPVMADDGTGGDVHIPSVMIHQEDATALMKLMNSTSKTILSLSWDVPHPDGRVEAALWFSSRSSPSLHAFIDRLRVIAQALGDSLLLTPYYDIHEGSTWGCSAGDDNKREQCRDLCVFDGEFCTYDPERDNTIGLDGRDVLEEDMRQLCVQEYALSKKDSSLFWAYVAGFNARCSPEKATKDEFNAACSRTVQEALAIPPRTIDECVQTSGRKLLKAQAEAHHTFHVINFPEFTVNDVPLYGGLECDESISLASCAPLKMICTGFLDGTIPQACHESYWKSGCTPPLERDDCGVCSLRNGTKWNQECVGCDGVPHSGKRQDECGICGGDGTYDVCGRCLPANDKARGQSCMDCKGVPNGYAKRDACGVCDGHGSFDACGLCLDATDPRRQNFVCHTMEDPDAVTSKIELQGLSMKTFHRDVFGSFQRAVAFVVDVKASEVVVKTVDEVAQPESHTPSTVVVFFVACPDDECRERVTTKLQEKTAALTITMKMKNDLEPLAYGTQAAEQIEHVALHSVMSTATTTGNHGISVAQESWIMGIAVACATTLAVGLIVIKLRDDRMRRDFHQLFARYTPLTAMDYEEEQEYGRSGRVSAEAW
ncbi:hypothetical protein Poli38472_008820 [Pythium oligandrum]|uniref:PA domain-containing protein n=1 Tax=Pythium oligandrum TaxID=41045 RepID=A0A8K1C4W3_PYTOL|nr:hypothetical protein Poli38472_008820 [Pythium oligandrum]|eukprot:TMW56172.1 hypothetical protein Poli38472_008820 [Pythium oligandrum]